MPIADIDLTNLFSEKFLVAIGATTGSLAAFAIGASFWLVKRVVDSEAAAAKVSLVRRFMAFCGLLLVVSAVSTVALAVNNRDKVVRASAVAQTATSEKNDAEHTLKNVVDEAALIKAANEEFSTRFKKPSPASVLSSAPKPSITPTTSVPPFNPKIATPALDQVLRKYEAQRLREVTK